MTVAAVVLGVGLALDLAARYFTRRRRRRRVVEWLPTSSGPPPSHVHVMRREGPP